MPQGAATLENSLRTLRVIHGTLMLAIVGYVVILRVIPGNASGPLTPQLLWGIAGVAVLEVVVALLFRMKKLGPVLEALRSRPDDVAALAQWRQAVIISDALALSVVLYGLVLHLLGSADRQAIPFFVAGGALMIFWWPGRP